MYFSSSVLLLTLASLSSAAVLPRQNKPFTAQNQAQALSETQSFSSLTPGGSCDPNNQNICVNGGPAACVNGKVVALGSCPAGLTCMSLPLVNKAGTSKSSCDTVQDGAARMGISVAQLQAALSGNGGNGNAKAVNNNNNQNVNNNQNKGNGNVSNSQTSTTSSGNGQNNNKNNNQNNGQNNNQNNSGAAGSTPQAQPDDKPFTLSNKKQALAENQKFGTLNASDSCDPATEAVACIGGKLAQCVNGSFIVGSACSGGLTCMSLPLLLKPGTSGASCDTLADGAARIGVSQQTLQAALNGGN